MIRQLSALSTTNVFVYQHNIICQAIRRASHWARTTMRAILPDVCVRRATVSIRRARVKHEQQREQTIDKCLAVRCLSSGLTCSSTTFTCQCSSVNYWNGTLCVPRLYPGQTCSSSMQCINSSSCSSFICVCNSNYYYSTLTGQCVPQLAYATVCTLGNYQCLNNTFCYDLLSPPAACTCDAAYYYYDGTRCVVYATYGETCAAAIYGPYCDFVSRSLVCIGTTCTCSLANYYNGSKCVPYRLVGFSCTASSQCVTNAYCSSSQTCLCLTTHYFSTANGSCLPLLSFGQSCTSSVQCPSNMLCTAGVCQCTPTTYFVSPNCVSRVSYGGSCSVTVLCDTTLGLTCTSSVCTCTTTQYWLTYSNGSQSCTNLRTLGQSCTSNTDCVNSGTSVKCTSSLCECDSSGYYLDQVNVVCLPLKAFGVACTSTYHFQCASLNCDTGNTCGTALPSTIISNVTRATSAGVSRRTDAIECTCFILSYVTINILSRV
jgi:hypothetical protein